MTIDEPKVAADDGCFHCSVEAEVSTLVLAAIELDFSAVIAKCLLLAREVDPGQ